MNNDSSPTKDSILEGDRDDIFRELDARPTFGAYTEAARTLRAIRNQLRPARIALLASFTVDSVVPFLEVEAARLGFGADVYVGPFNSIKQEMLNGGSGCVRHNPDIVFVADLLEDVCPPLANDFLSLDAVQRRQLMENVVSDMATTVATFRKHSRASVVVWNFARSLYPPLGIYEVMAKGSQTALISELNVRLAEALSMTPGVYVLDYNSLLGDVGYRNFRDEKMWALGRAPLSMQTLPALARIHAAFFHALLAPQRKCLVLDLDNTLWGGIVGEDGLAGIKLGHTFPGNVYRDFQLAVLELYRRGILLAINSKNNPADVEEVFRSHPDMILKLEHFAATRINWRAKPDNMNEIAKELNIGVDSLVFFDDNPAEQALMKQTLPQVLTLPAGPDPMKFSHLLRDSHVFDRLSFTDEDRRRGEMYREQAVRSRLEQSAGSVEEFLTSLKMTVSVKPVDQFSFPRLVDLLQKTNQFNLTTRRHSATVLTAMMQDPAYGIFSLRVADRFGDNGIVGVAIVHASAEKAVIDSLLLSCRVIGRTVETALLAAVVEWAQSRGVSDMEGEFIPTAKNAPASDFFARHGFTHVDSDGGRTRWTLSLSDVPFHWPEYLQREEQSADKQP